MMGITLTNRLLSTQMHILIVIRPYDAILSLNTLQIFSSIYT